MKKAFIVTSAIDVNQDAPLTYSNIRTIFSNEERFRHTIFTITSLDLATDQDSTIFLIDTSEDYQKYKSILGYQSNLVYISVKEEFPDAYHLARTHPNKSYCETILLLKFFEKYKSQLEQFDYFFKLSGRYFTDSSFDISIFDENKIDKIFFKQPLQFDWNERWEYHMVDRRSIQGDEKLRQYSSVLYGWGKNCHYRMLDIFKVVAVFTSHHRGIRYDLETLLYYFTRTYEQDIIETNWKVYGWEGVSGNFMRY
jgi:hypothetical protein